jgi:hypothetical protein
MVAFVCIYINAKKFEETIEFYKKLLNKDIEVQYKTRWAQIKINEGMRLAFLNIKFDKDAIENNIDIKKHYNDDFIRNLPVEYCSGNSIVLNMVAQNFHKEYERVKRLSANVSPIQYVNYMMPYHFFTVEDPEGNLVEIADT